MATPVTPLDFERIISYAIGDVTMFFYITVIALSILSAKLRVPIAAYFLMMIVLVLIFFTTMNVPVVRLILIVVMIVVGGIMAKTMKQ